MSNVKLKPGVQCGDVLRALYKRAKPQGMGFLHFKADDTLPEAEDLVKDQSYFDYLKGRVMKIEINDKTVVRGLNVALYDRDNGIGAAEAALREAGLTP